MKGFLVFCAAVLAVVFIGLALPYLDDRDRDYEQRFVGALNFTEKTIEATLGGAAVIYEPAIASGTWADGSRGT